MYRVGLISPPKNKRHIFIEADNGELIARSVPPAELPTPNAATYYPRASGNRLAQRKGLVLDTPLLHRGKCYIF